MTKLSAAETRLIEGLRLALIARRGLGKPESAMTYTGADYDLAMSDAVYIAGWIEATASKAADPEAVALPKVASFVADDGETYVRTKAPRMVPRVPGEPTHMADSSGFVWNMTPEQVDWLDAEFGEHHTTTVERIRAFYTRAHLDNNLPALPHVDEGPRPCVQDQLAVDDHGVVHRFAAYEGNNPIPPGMLGGDWIIVNEFPGYRIARGVLHWAAGTWPPLKVKDFPATTGEAAVVPAE